MPNETLKNDLQARSESKCELCSAVGGLEVYEVPPSSKGEVDTSVLLCATCFTQIENPDQADANHWRCLNDSMWSHVPAVQVVVWRLLNQLSDEGWPVDLLEMLYLDEETQAWAEAMAANTEEPKSIIHKDCNGAILEGGDSVSLIKDLNVKGANFTAKRGTVVRGISLVSDNPEHVEGKISGQRIVILTKFVRKAN